MLNSHSTAQGMVVAGNASARGLVLSAIPASPLAALVTTLSGITEAEFRNKGADAIMSASAPHALNPHDHGEEVAVLAHNLKSVLERKTLRLIQEEINPLVREIRSEITRARIEIAEQNALGLGVQLHRLPNVYSSSYLEQAVKNPSLREQRKKSIGGSLLRKLVSDLTVPQLIETMKTPSAEINTELAALVTKSNEAYVGNEKSYVDTGFEVSGVIFLEPKRIGLMSAYLEHSDLLTFMFLRGVRAGNHPLVSPDALDANERVELAGAISSYQWAVNQRMDYLAREAKNERVFLGTENKKIVHADEARYMKWVEAEENTKELVLGALVAYGTTATNVLNGEIKDPKELVDRYNFAMKKASVISRTVSESQIERITESAIVRHLNSEAERSETAKESLRDDVAAVREYFNHARKDQLTTDVAYVTRAVCKTIGRGLDAEVVITEMQNYLERDGNEDASLQKALEFGIARLLARFMAKQTITQPFSVGNELSTPVSVG
ncbi:hypothetical protein CZP2022_242 [Vibrio phage C-ZP2022]|nr:hypothetical protein CZP2022_242 [Vibrio phage C-ZP2022]